MGTPERRAGGKQMAEIDPAGSGRDGSKRKIGIVDWYTANNNPPVAGPQGGSWNFLDIRKFVVRLSHKLLGDASLCRFCADVKQTPGHFFLVLVSFLELLVDGFLEPVFAEE